MAIATLAKEKSTDIISARNGGDMGWLEESATVPELKNAGLKEKGQSVFWWRVWMI
ncbi:Peptidyl-prolyl cis-trans isomerase PpiD, partial [Salmonella enterica subsp. enterica serovar Hvittingfoss str. A4-620]